MSPYTVPFCFAASRLILEVAGDYHQTEKVRVHDEDRDGCLAEQGYTVLRASGYQAWHDSAAVRSLTNNPMDERNGPFGPLTPNPSPPAR